MLKSVLLATLAVSAVAGPVPTASADAPTYDCDVRSVRRHDEAAPRFDAVVTGSAAHAEGGAVTLRCYLDVDGTTVAEVPVGTGTGFASTAGVVTFWAYRDAGISLTAEVTTSHGTEYRSEPYDPYAEQPVNDLEPLPYRFGCYLNAVQLDSIGQSFEGVAVGQVTSGDAELAIRCYVAVNGVEVTSTTTGRGSFAVVAGHVSFSAGDGDYVELCAEATTWYDGYGYYPDIRCYPTAGSPLPPEVADLVARAVVTTEELTTWAACPTLAALSGSYAWVTIGWDGDVFVDGVLIYDCPPYTWPSGGPPWSPKWHSGTVQAG